MRNVSNINAEQISRILSEKQHHNKFKLILPEIMLDIVKAFEMIRLYKKSEIKCMLQNSIETLAHLK